MALPQSLYSLSESELKTKMRKRQQVEQHWSCPIDQVLPVAIRPRFTTTRAKAKVGERAAEAEWWRWSADLFYKLENLAAMTPGRLPFAQALMLAEVSQRQQDHTNSSRETAELLKSDVVRIIAELRERTASGGQDSEDDEAENDDDDDYDVEDRPDNAESQDEGSAAADLRGEEECGMEMAPSLTRSSSTIKVEEPDDIDFSDRSIKPALDTTPAGKRKSSSHDFPASKRHATGSAASQSQASRAFLEKRADIASLRAGAARLRQQASQRETKAYKLEAELLEHEAGEVVD